MARAAAVIAVAIAASSCGIGKQTPPELGGPSGYALSLSMAATPDLLPRDGSSQATITIVARDQVGAAVPNLRLLGGAVPDATSLSQTEIITDSQGRATFAITAPPQSTVAQNNQIIVSILPVGDNFANATGRSLSIGLLGPSNTTRPTPTFTFTPDAPDVMQTVVFDASATTDEGVTCENCSFEWSFGDGGTASGRIATHSFATAGNFAVTVTATDITGTTGTSVQGVTIGAPTAPSAEFVFSPGEPIAGQTVHFDASTSTVGEGVTIESYAWNFGDGTTGTGRTAQHAYAAAGDYTVVLTITDSLGRTNLDVGVS